MSVPLNEDGTVKGLEISLPKIRKWKRKQIKRFLRMLEGNTSAEKLEEQDRFLADYSNWSLAEIDELDSDEYEAIFKRIGEIVQENGVPKASGASS